MRRDRSAFAGDLRRDSLRKLAQRAIVDQQVGFGLSEHIDKARRNNQTFGVDYPLRVNAFEPSDGSDVIATNSNVAGHPGISRAVNNRAILDKYIVFVAGGLARLRS